MLKTLILFVLFFPFSAGAKDCLRRAGALDIGSGSTKALAAEIDVCKDRVVRILFQKNIPLAFNESLGRSPSGLIETKLIKEAGVKIAALAKEIRDLKVEKISAAATSVFRKAVNGEAAAADIARAAGIPVKILSQAEEAAVGARSALSKLPKTGDAKAPLVVWDIGGGSMQMWSRDGAETRLFEGDLAAVSFKNRVLRELQGKDPKEVASPNPLGKARGRAVRLAKEDARTKVPAFFRENAARARWIGIGGVLALSVQKQAAPSAREFTRAELSSALQRRSELGDDKLEGDYRSTDVTNLALVLGYMETLGLRRIETVEVSLAEGWLLQSVTAAE